jgi:pilus assembly protein Flp/PilA
MNFLKDRAGATAIEYGLIAAFVALIIISTIAAMGTQLVGMFNAVGAGFSGS